LFALTWFSGKTAVVTGAARGIGEGVARRLAELGAQVVAVDCDERTLHAAFAGQPGISPLLGMLGDGQEAVLADTVCNRFGIPELIVNNVGVDGPGSFLEIDEPDFDSVFATNLRGPWFFTRQLVEALIDRKAGGAIVFISSLHDHIVRTRPHYSASKAAVAMLVRELAHELGPHGIRVNAIAPGVVRSGSVPGPGGGDEPRVRRIVPLGRIGEPRDVASMVAVLLSEEWSAYVTGANVPVDGGLNLYTWSAAEKGSDSGCAG
jgi:NAD(P)-dependent dehydrogenase (short-subunit alcohol dehydrogenase family)